MKHYYKKIKSPVGTLTLVASSEGLKAILWKNEKPGRVPLVKIEKDSNHPVLLMTEKQLHEYFEGKRKRFSIPLDLKGTEFQKMVWKALLAIPFGATKSYGEIARQLKRPKAIRAVGAANGRNPISIIIPCHRVIGSNGDLTGFAGGIKAKAYLLNHETN